MGNLCHKWDHGRQQKLEHNCQNSMQLCADMLPFVNGSVENCVAPQTILIFNHYSSTTQQVSCSYYFAIIVRLQRAWCYLLSCHCRISSHQVVCARLLANAQEAEPWRASFVRAPRSHASNSLDPGGEMRVQVIVGLSHNAEVCCIGVYGASASGKMFHL